MSSIALTLLLLTGLGFVLLLGELLLPTHGILGIAGLAALGAAIGVCFYIDRWLGMGVLLAAVIASPFVGAFFIRMWPRTPIGRRMMLQPVNSALVPPSVAVGQVGIAMSELRPMGECEFDGHRIEVISEYGMIRTGERVKVVSYINGRPAVRADTRAGSVSSQQAGQQYS